MAAIFDLFCNYVDETLFSKENKGEIVAFVVDHTFITEFCHTYNITEDRLLEAVFDKLYSYSRNHLHIKGILAIQLYAATKREYSDGVTEANYRDRLSQVLNWDIGDLQRWMADYQEEFWSLLYQWCDKNGYIIAKCARKKGHGRYVQYPVQQARRIFTEEDLKYISYHFVDKKILPNEDLSQKDLWRILGEHRLDSYVHTNHGKQLVGEPEYRQDAYRQIFNYYLRWDGSFTDIFKQKAKHVQKELAFLYLSGDYSSLDVRNESMKLIKKIPIDKLILKTLEGLYHFKRKGIILFKKNDIYENYWQETRYLEGDEDGIAIVFKDDRLYNFNQKYPLQEFNRHAPLLKSPSFDIFEITHIRGYSELYTEKRFYSLEGGLKVGRMQYLDVAPPFLKIEKPSFFLIDGEEPPVGPHDGYLLLNFLSKGKHNIKFPNHKKLEFEIVHCDVAAPCWKDSYNKWNISRKEKSWDSSFGDSGIVGLDFSCVKISSDNNNDRNLVTKWALLHQGVYSGVNEKNVALKLLSNSNGSRI